VSREMISREIMCLGERARERGGVPEVVLRWLVVVVVVTGLWKGQDVHAAGGRLR
jgi:hypothetical protein